MRRRSQRAGVLVQAIVVLAGLVALMVSIAASQRVTVGRLQDRLRERRAEVAAQSAVAAAVATLQSANTNLVTLNDDWAQLGNGGSDAYTVGGATWRVQIVDTGALININQAPDAQLQQLPLTDEQRESLLDWREPAGAARANGAKDAYYNALSQPYNARLAPLESVSELLLVRGWTASTLYRTPENTTGTVELPTGPDGKTLPLAAILTVSSTSPNTRVDGSVRVNLNQRNVAAAGLGQFGIPLPQAIQLAARAPFTSFADLLPQPGLSLDSVRQLLDAATFTPNARWEGKINVNTASEAVLQTLPNMTADIASAIVARQSTGFTSLGDLTTVPGLSGGPLTQVADRLTVGSDTWLVRAHGESGGIGVSVEAVVGVRNGRAQVLRYERLPNPEVPLWWGWQETPTEVPESAPTITTTTAGGAR